MFRPWTAALCLSWAASGWVACGGTVETLPPKDEGGAGGSGGEGVGGSADTGGTGGSGGTGFPTGGASTGATGGYVDPGCPDVPLPEPYYECDPLEPDEGCPDGYGCYPFVSHPFGTGCGTQQFGAICSPAGTGRHGDLCGDDHGPCAPGFLCVVGAAAGKRCAQVCLLDEEHDCPEGLICGETDVAGFGVCY